MDADEALRRDAMVDGAIAQAGGAQLMAGDDAVLGLDQVGQRGVTV
jgi:hypothetical protein